MSACIRSGVLYIHELMFSARIDRLLRKVKALRLLRMTLHCLFLAAGAYLLWMLVQGSAEKYLFYYPVAAVTLFTPLLIFLLARTFLRFHSEKDPHIATQVDRQYGLKDRIATYVELRGTSHPFLEPLIAETESRIDVVSAARSAEFGKGASAPVLFAAIPAVCLLILPYLPVPEKIAERVEQHRRINSAARKLEEQAARIEKEAEKLPELKKVSEQVQELAKELQKTTTDASEALKKLNAAQEQLREIENSQKQAQKDALSRDLSRMAKEGNESGNLSEEQKRQMQRTAEELAKALADQNLEGGKEAQEALNQGKLSKEQMEKMKQALEKFKQEQAESEKRMAELQKSMENTKKSAQTGKGSVTYNSKLEGREVEKGKGGVEDGPGTTNTDIGPNKFDTTKQGKGEYAQDLTKAEYEQFYKGQREKAGSDPLLLDGQWDPQNARFTRIRTFGLDSESGATSGSSSDTVPQSGEESVIGKEKVPASYRKMVKKYFESIQQ